ncbi:hypothetical protein [Bordetella genomosp. 5]|uniref:hypothetical protein n=1 Tax=Bordetella genomosp. 5 TaxID=1395608 RepID=UPI0020168857|nr:hypothetical protein [Bordetella genomosp. 5]
MPILSQVRAFSRIKTAAVMSAAAFALAGGAATAQQPMPGQQGMPNLAALSGQMHAAAEACNAYTSAQLEQMKQQQKTATASQGMSAADFDKSFKTSYDDTKTKLGTMSAADKEKMCAQLKAMSGAR